jgi:hypothetical protein
MLPTNTSDPHTPPYSRMKKTTKTAARIAEREELLELLTVRAREGSVTAAKALLEELRRDDGGADDDWSGIYGEGKVTPLRRSS